MKTIALVLSLGLILISPAIASAQSMTVAQLQAEIQSLTSELQSLQQQLAAMTGGGSSAASCYSFNENLSLGASGSAVNALQTELQKDGESVTVNGTFDNQTAAAVTAFQEKYAGSVLTPNGLSSGTGYVGKSTRAKLNSLFGCTTSISTSTPPVACNNLAPYCPYGSYFVTQNGCQQIVCVPGPSANSPSSSFPTPVCPLTGQAPDCTYGSHVVTDSNGCGEVVCNSAPTAAPY